MKHNLTVAAVVPVLNEEQALPALISRLQQLDVDECVIVDGGSGDATQEMLQHSGLKWINSKAGRAVQMNAGAALTKADIILFIHADTVIASSNIEAIRDAMSDACFVGGRFDVRLSGSHPMFRVIEWFINTRSRLTRISTGDQCQFVRRAVFESMDGFPELPLMEDIEFSKRLKRGGNIACLKQRVTTSSRRWQRFGILRTIVLMWKLRFLYWLGREPETLSDMYRQVR